VTVASLAAHVGAHALLAGSSAGHVHHHAGTASHWRSCALVCGTVLAVSLGVYVLASARRGRAADPPMWLAVLLPPLGFALAGGVGTRTLVLGLLLQLPVVAAFALAARALPGRAAALGRALRSLPRPRLAAAPIGLRPGRLQAAPVPVRLPRSVSERGPPRFRA
jgi:hypothetical protein